MFRLDCVFCDIVAGKLPAKTVYESERVIAFEDIQKMAPVHILVVPKDHLESIADIDPSDAPLLSEIQRAVVEVARSAGISDSGFRVVANKGKAAGQSVFHAHFHVLGGKDLLLTLA